MAAAPVPFQIDDTSPALFQVPKLPADKKLKTKPPTLPEIYDKLTSKEKLGSTDTIDKIKYARSLLEQLANLIATMNVSDDKKSKAVSKIKFLPIADKITAHLLLLIISITGFDDKNVISWFLKIMKNLPKEIAETFFALLKPAQDAETNPGCCKSKVADCTATCDCSEADKAQEDFINAINLGIGLIRSNLYKFYDYQKGLFDESDNLLSHAGEYNIPPGLFLPDPEDLDICFSYSLKDSYCEALLKTLPLIEIFNIFIKVKYEIYTQMIGKRNGDLLVDIVTKYPSKNAMAFFILFKDNDDLSSYLARYLGTFTDKEKLAKLESLSPIFKGYFTCRKQDKSSISRWFIDNAKTRENYGDLRLSEDIDNVIKFWLCKFATLEDLIQIAIVESAFPQSEQYIINYLLAHSKLFLARSFDPVSNIDILIDHLLSGEGNNENLLKLLFLLNGAKPQLIIFQIGDKLASDSTNFPIIIAKYPTLFLQYFLDHSDIAESLAEYIELFKLSLDAKLLLRFKDHSELFSAADSQEKLLNAFKTICRFGNLNKICTVTFLIKLYLKLKSNDTFAPYKITFSEILSNPAIAKEFLLSLLLESSERVINIHNLIPLRDILTKALQILATGPQNLSDEQLSNIIIVLCDDRNGQLVIEEATLMGLCNNRLGILAILLICPNAKIIAKSNPNLILSMLMIDGPIPTADILINLLLLSDLDERIKIRINLILKKQLDAENDSLLEQLLLNSKVDNNLIELIKETVLIYLNNAIDTIESRQIINGLDDFLATLIKISQNQDILNRVKILLDKVKLPLCKTLAAILLLDEQNRYRQQLLDAHFYNPTLCQVLFEQGYAFNPESVEQMLIAISSGAIFSDDILIKLIQPYLLSFLSIKGKHELILKVVEKCLKCPPEGKNNLALFSNPTILATILSIICSDSPEESLVLSCCNIVNFASVVPGSQPSIECFLQSKREFILQFPLCVTTYVFKSPALIISIFKSIDYRLVELQFRLLIIMLENAGAQLQFIEQLIFDNLQEMLINCIPSAKDGKVLLKKPYRFKMLIKGNHGIDKEFDKRSDIRALLDEVTGEEAPPPAPKKSESPKPASNAECAVAQPATHNTMPASSIAAAKEVCTTTSSAASTATAVVTSAAATASVSADASAVKPAEAPKLDFKKNLAAAVAKCAELNDTKDSKSPVKPAEPSTPLHVPAPQLAKPADPAAASAPVSQPAKPAEEATKSVPVIPGKSTSIHEVVSIQSQAAVLFILEKHEASTATAFVDKASNVTRNDVQIEAASEAPSEPKHVESPKPAPDAELPEPKPAESPKPVPEAASPEPKPAELPNPGVHDTKPPSPIPEQPPIAAAPPTIAPGAPPPPDMSKFKEWDSKRIEAEKKRKEDARKDDHTRDSGPASKKPEGEAADATDIPKDMPKPASPPIPVESDHKDGKEAAAAPLPNRPTANMIQNSLLLLKPPKKDDKLTVRDHKPLEEKMADSLRNQIDARRTSSREDTDDTPNYRIHLVQFNEESNFDPREIKIAEHIPLVIKILKPDVRYYVFTYDSDSISLGRSVKFDETCPLKSLKFEDSLGKIVSQQLESKVDGNSEICTFLGEITWELNIFDEEHPFADKSGAGAAPP